MNPLSSGYSDVCYYPSQQKRDEQERKTKEATRKFLNKKLGKRK